MRRNVLFAVLTSAIFLSSLVVNKKTIAQSNLPPFMVTRAVDETQRVSLRGNVVPMARAENAP